MVRMATKYQLKKATSFLPATSEEITNEVSAGAAPSEGRRKRKRSKQSSLELLKMQVFANGDLTPPHQLAREGTGGSEGDHRELQPHSQGSGRGEMHHATRRDRDGTVARDALPRDRHERGQR